MEQIDTILSNKYKVIGEKEMVLTVLLLNNTQVIKIRIFGVIMFVSL